jgi:hypothetical protein
MLREGDRKRGSEIIAVVLSEALRKFREAKRVFPIEGLILTLVDLNMKCAEQSVALGSESVWILDRFLGAVNIADAVQRLVDIGFYSSRQ